MYKNSIALILAVVLMFLIWNDYLFGPDPFNIFNIHHDFMTYFSAFLVLLALGSLIVNFFRDEKEIEVYKEANKINVSDKGALGAFIIGALLIVLDYIQPKIFYKIFIFWYVSPFWIGLFLVLLGFPGFFKWFRSRRK